MRRAGRVVAEMHERIRAAIRPGVTTAELDRIGRDVLERRGATSNFLGYHGYPAVICASVNEIVVHGIPRRPIRLDEGDLVSIDCGAIVDGWHGDAAFTAGVGHGQRRGRAADRRWPRPPSPPPSTPMVPGNRVGDIGAAVEATVLAAGLRRGARLLRSRHRPGHARVARRAQLRPARAGGPSWRPGSCWRWSRWWWRADRGGGARRRLERAHRRRALGGPRRAHDRRHRRRPRNPRRRRSGADSLRSDRRVLSRHAARRLRRHLAAAAATRPRVGVGTGERAWSRALCARAGRR